MDSFETQENSLIQVVTDRFRLIERLGLYARMLGDVVVVTLRKPPSLTLILKQFYDIGVSSLPVVAITGFSSGLVLSAQSFFQLSDKGLAGVTGLVVAKAMMTELGPVMTAFMVTGRVGAAICAELGTMRVTEQIDALQSMAINPLRYLVAPRFIAGCFMMPLLTVFSIIMGVFGGYLIAIYLFSMAPSIFFDPIQTHLTFFDFFTGVVKAFVFGVFIMSISCFKGIHTTGGAAGVGKAITQCVVMTYCCILLSNFFLTLGLNVFRFTLSRLF